MSLEELVKEETGNNFKEKLIHYSKFTASSLYRGAIDMFRLPTANRLRREAESQRTPKFLEEVIRDSVRGSVQMFVFGSFLLSPYLGLTALATNTASYVHERFFACRKNIFTWQKKTSRIKKLARQFAKFACIYTLVGSMAIAHLTIGSSLRPTPKYNPDLLNVEVQKISMKKDEKTYEFYLLGEVHLYNHSSSVYARELIKQKNISMLLSEGVDVGEYYDFGTSEPISIRELMQNQFSEVSWRNVCEGLLGATYAVTLLGSDYKYQSPSEICYEKGILVIFLEKPVIREYGGADGVGSQKDEVFLDGREGVGSISYALIGASGIFSMLYAPQMYFLTNSARYFPLKNMQKILPINFLFPGIINKRNELMTKEAFKKISQYKEYTCLMRVGLAHVEGIIEEFKKYGKVSVEGVKIDVK